jgi:hypothetical protein
MTQKSIEEWTHKGLKCSDVKLKVNFIPLFVNVLGFIQRAH